MHRQFDTPLRIAASGMLALALAACSGGAASSSAPSAAASAAAPAGAGASEVPSAAPASAAPAASGQALQSVSLATLGPSSLLWLHAIANAEGFYAQHGVQVTTIQIQSSSTLVQAVASGSADAGISLGDNVISAVNQGASIVISGVILQKAALRLYGASNIKTIAALKGTKVTAGAVSGGTADLLLYQLQQAGVSKSDLQMLALTNSSDRVVALKDNQVQGALLIPPFDTLAVADGANYLGWYNKPYIETPLIVNVAWAKAHAAAAQGVTQALAEAAAWVYRPANASAAEQILSKYTNASATAAADAYKFLVTDGQVISPNLQLDPGGLQDIVDIAAAVGDGTQTTLQTSKYYDPSYLK